MNSTKSLLGDRFAPHPKILGTKDVKSPKNPRNKGSKEVDRDVEYLVQTFNSEAHIPLFRHIAWQLPSTTIKRKAGEAKELATSSPIGYFIKLAKQEGYKPPQKAT